MRIADHEHMAELSRRVARDIGVTISDRRAIAAQCLNECQDWVFHAAVSRTKDLTPEARKLVDKMIAENKRRALAYVACARYNRLLAELADWHAEVQRNPPPSDSPVWTQYGQRLDQWYREFCKNPAPQKIFENQKKTR